VRVEAVLSSLEIPVVATEAVIEEQRSAFWNIGQVARVSQVVEKVWCHWTKSLVSLGKKFGVTGQKVWCHWAKSLVSLGKKFGVTGQKVWFHWARKKQ